ncbi:MAG: VCBS repeat-containing protein [Planctomycetes bacterium]|nr:VCBS repeat-containing protein [Planctomycetota bacterium]
MRQLPLTALLLAPQADAPRLAVVAVLEPPFEVAEVQALDVADALGHELVLIGAAGEVRTTRLTEAGFAPLAGELALFDARRAVFAFAPLAGEGRPDLFVATPRGLEVFRAGADGAFGRVPLASAQRARFTLRTALPLAAPLAVDIDGDGRTDAVVPDGERLDVWLQRPATGEGTGPAFVRSASVRVPISMARSTGAVALSDRYDAGLTIPNLRRLDVNGDGRLDLVVEDREIRAFHLVRPDGSLPGEPDAVLDLSIFKDSTAEGGVTPGRTLSGSDRTLHELRDLDGDGIPDHVIAHRRKVWVFRGGPEAPQFRSPSSILKTADDVTGLLLLDLDGDARPDLVLLRVQVPSVAAILRGLVAEWEVEAAAAGYRAGGERDFEPTPHWRSTLRFRVPAILSILKDPDAIVRRFEEAGRKFARSAEGDVDGDGRADALIVSEDGTRIDLWLGHADAARAARQTPAEIVRQALFGEAEASWDLDRLVTWFAGVGERRLLTLTGGRPPAGSLALRAPDAWRLVDLTVADLRGDGRALAVLRYESADGSRTVVDILGWHPG